MARNKQYWDKWTCREQSWKVIHVTFLFPLLCNREKVVVLKMQLLHVLDCCCFKKKHNQQTMLRCVSPLRKCIFDHPSIMFTGIVWWQCLYRVLLGSSKAGRGSCLMDHLLISLRRVRLLFVFYCLLFCFLFSSVLTTW